MWVADEGRDAVQVYKRLQITLFPKGVKEWWWEMNTSQNDVKPGRPNLVNYLRNVAFLRDLSYGDVPTILKRPVE
jgi:hypothetical protein